MPSLIRFTKLEEAMPRVCSKHFLNIIFVTTVHAPHAAVVMHIHSFALKKLENFKMV